MVVYIYVHSDEERGLQTVKVVRIQDLCALDGLEITRPKPKSTHQTDSKFKTYEGSIGIPGGRGQSI